MNQRKQAITQSLAKLVGAALVAEVKLSPKPGLVDAFTSGAHTDMDLALFMKSAKTLTPYFAEMAQAAWQQPLDQKLRAKIAAIGRQAETAMRKATAGVNTHKGAIWTLGLLITVLSHSFSFNQPFAILSVLSEVGKLAALPDPNYQSKQPTHGQLVKQKYGRSGAYEEAVSGYPHIVLALKAYHQASNASQNEKQLQMLLCLMSSVEDTCVLHRSDQNTLAQMQSLAFQSSQTPLPNASFKALIDFCQAKQISPGGSADLLAASFFLIAVTQQLHQFASQPTAGDLFQAI